MTGQRLIWAIEKIDGNVVAGLLINRVEDYYRKVLLKFLMFTIQVLNCPLKTFLLGIENISLLFLNCPWFTDIIFNFKVKPIINSSLKNHQSIKNLFSLHATPFQLRATPQLQRNSVADIPSWITFPPVKWITLNNESYFSISSDARADEVSR